MRQSLLLFLLFLASAGFAADVPGDPVTAVSPDKKFFAAIRGVPDDELIWKTDLDRFRLVVFRHKTPDQIGALYARGEGGARQAVKMLWSPDSKFLVFSTTSSGGHSPWHFWTYVFSVADKTLRRVDDFAGPITDAKFHFELPDILVVQVRDYEHELGQPGESKTMKVRLHEVFRKMPKL
jgi:hypothetical protein